MLFSPAEYFSSPLTFDMKYCNSKYLMIYNQITSCHLKNSNFSCFMILFFPFLGIKISFLHLITFCTFSLSHNWPFLPDPQALIVPSSKRNKECLIPADILITFSVILRGVNSLTFFTCFPRPNCPNELDPHPKATPSWLIARLKSQPAETSVKPLCISLNSLKSCVVLSPH